MPAYQFNKNQAKAYIQALREGRPIEGVTSVSDAVTLAGVCFHLASTGTVCGPAQGLSIRQAMMHPEQREASLDATHQNIKNGLMFFGYLASQVDWELYDRAWEEAVEIKGAFDTALGAWKIEVASGQKD